MECVSVHPSFDEVESKLDEKRRSIKLSSQSSSSRWGGCFCAVPQDPTIELDALLSDDDDDENCETECHSVNGGRVTPSSCVSLNPISPPSRDDDAAAASPERKVIDMTSSPSSPNEVVITEDEAAPILISVTTDSSGSERDDIEEEEVTTLPSFVDVTSAQRVKADSHFTLRSSLDSLADRFANFLCPGSNVAAVVHTTNVTTSGTSPRSSFSTKLQNSNNNNKKHTKAELERLRSISSLVTAPSFKASNEITRPTTPFPATTTSCTDLILVNDIMMMPPNGLELFSALRAWLPFPASVGHNDDGARPRICNRSTATPSRLRCARVMDLWGQWHAGSSAALHSFHAPSIQPCSSVDQVALGARHHHSHNHHHHLLQSSTPSSTTTRTSLPSPSPPQDLCYDSDPELILRTLARRQSQKRRPPKFHRCRPGAIKTTIEMSPSEDETARQFCPPVSPQYRYPKTAASTKARRFFGRERSPHSVADYHKAGGDQEQRVKNPDAAMQELIKETAIGKVSLVFHGVMQKQGPLTATESTNKVATTLPQQQQQQPPRPTTPMSVRAWFEVGRRLGTVVVQPKLIWCPAYHPLVAGGTTRRGWALPFVMEALDLLTIVRVIQPKTMDRDLYPYARIGRTFQITSQDNRIFSFEAPSRTECERFVMGLKLMVARLASIVIVRDETMLHEFFSPWAHSPMLDQMLQEMQGEEEGSQANQAANEAPQPSERSERVEQILGMPSSKGFGCKVWSVKL